MKFVLIAENDKANQVLLRKVFEDLGFATYEAIDCKQALGVLKDRPVDLIVAAQTLPGGDFLTQVRDSHTSEVPFVFLSDLNGAQALKKSPDEFNGYLLKPVTPARAAEKLSEIFSDFNRAQRTKRALKTG